MGDTTFRGLATCRVPSEKTGDVSHAGPMRPVKIPVIAIIFLISWVPMLSLFGHGSIFQLLLA
jgi:hypothetical protein